MENVHLLKKYFLPYASCITCSIKYDEFSSDLHRQCPDHEHIFTNFYVEQHMIPIIIQQFLTDLGVKNSSNALTNYSSENLDDALNALHSIDINKIEQFWMGYVDAIPNDLETIWDTIVNGLLRYLQVFIFSIHG